MSKPLGMTASFQVVRPSGLEDRIYDIVEECVRANITPEHVIREIRDDWGIVLTEKANADDMAFAKALK